MTVAADIQLLAPSAVIELFVLDATIFGGEVTRFHAGTNELMQNLVWQGNTYTRLSVKGEGFDVSAQGTMPRPKLTLMNQGGLFSYDVMAHDDLVNCKITRKRTLLRYLDEVNFVAGNPTANPAQSFADEVWYIEQKITENSNFIQWELASPFDLVGVQLPRRQMIEGSCPWKYRSSECGYTGTNYFDGNDAPTNVGNDVCSKSLAGCKKRFPAPVPLPFGGFPGVVRYQS